MDTVLSPKRVRVLINALALHAAADAARVFLENLIIGLPRAWPEAEVIVVIRRGTDVPVQVERARILVIGSAGSGALRVVDEMFRLPAVIRRVCPDVVINPNESIPRGIDAPLVLVAQNLLFHCPDIEALDTGPVWARVRSQLQFRFYRWRMPQAYSRANAVIPVSQHAARQLEERAGLDRWRVHVVPYGADRLPIHPRAVDPGARRLLVVGAIAYYKRLVHAVEALAHLSREGEDYELVLAGEEWPGHKDVIRAAASRAGVEHRLRFVGAVHGDELARLYATSHAGLSLSACESFGIPIVEGMRAGLPHVVADEPWSVETVGDDAIRVEASSPRSVAEGIRQLEDAAVWERMAEYGRKRAARYTWASNATGIARVAAGVVEGTGGPHESLE